MILSILLLLSSTRLSTAYPSPGLTYLPKGKCAYAGQVVCASESTFAICDASLTGIIQPLANGDTRCGDFGAGNAPTAAAAAAAATAPASFVSRPTAPPHASSTTPTNLQGNPGFMKTIESMVAPATPPAPPPPLQSGGPTSSSTAESLPKQTTSKFPPAASPTTPAPHFAQGPSLAVVPTTLPAAVPPRQGCNPAKSTCSGGS